MIRNFLFEIFLFFKASARHFCVKICFFLKKSGSGELVRASLFEIKLKFLRNFCFLGKYEQGF